MSNPTGLRLVEGEVPLRDLPSYESTAVTRGSVKWTQQTPVQQRGTHVEHLPAQASFSVDHGPVTRLPAFGRIHACPDIQTAVRWRDAIRHALTQLNSPYLTYKMAAEQLSKWVPESGSPPGWYIQPAPPALAEPVSPVIWRHLNAQVGAQPATLPSRSVTKFSNHGDPTWRKSLEDQIAHIAMSLGIKTWDDVLARNREMGELIDRGGLPADPTGILFSRTGPNRKPTALRAFIKGILTTIGEANGYFCRRRHVKGVPTWLNEVVRREVMNAYDTAKANCPWLNHSTPQATLTKIRDFSTRTGYELWSDDATNFDDTVSIVHQNDLVDHVLARFLGEKTALYKHLTTRIGLLTGPVNENYRAFVWDRRGGVLSGVVSTTLEGSLINAACVLSSLAAGYHVSPSTICEWHAKRKFLMLIAGDDTLLVIPRGLDKDAYVAQATAHGFVRKLETYPVFLMTWYDPPDRWHGIAARALMRTATRERPAAGPATELFGTWARWERCQADPLFTYMWAVMQENNPLIGAYGIRSFKDLGKAVTSTDVQDKMEAEIHSSQGEEAWISMMKGLTRYEGELEADGLLATLLDRFGGMRALAARETSHSELVARAASFDWRRYLRDTTRKSEVSETTFDLEQRSTDNDGR